MSKQHLKGKFGNGILATAVAGACVISFECDQSHAGESAARDTRVLEEIIVSARKREESLMEVPMAIQVFDAGTLEQLGIDDFEDYARYAPGVSFTKRGAGQTHVVMRGLSTGNVANSQPQNRALVGIYLDDVPIQLNGYNFDPDLFDIARVEVLKGPQGTLFGDSAMAGAIRYVTVRPNVDETEARIKLSTSTTEQGGESYNVRGMVNFPVSGQFALRASGYYRDESGWIDNIRLPESDINSEEIYGGRLAALYRPSEVLSIQAMVGAQRSRLGGRAQADGLTEPTAFTQDRDRERTYEEALLANLTVTANLAGGAFTSVTGYVNRDFESYEALFIDRLFVLFFGENLPNNTLYYPWKQDYRTQEFRFNSTVGERAEYTLGAFLARQAINYPTYGYVPGFDQFLIEKGFASSVQEIHDTFGCPLPEFPDHDFCGYLNTTQKQVALFGDTTINLTSRLQLLAGARYVDWKQDFDENYAGFFNGGPSAKQQTTNENTINPRFGLTYTFSDAATTFLNIGKGFRLGGVNDPLPPTCDAEVEQLGFGRPDRFESDSLWNYELGAKTLLANRRWLLNGSVFFVRWDDVQTTRHLTCGYRIIQNAGKVISRGLEMDSRILVSDNFQLSIGGSYTQAELDEDSPNLGAVKGDRVPFVPEWKIAAFASYQFPLSQQWQAFVDGGITAYGESFTTFSPAAPDRLRIPSASIGSLSVGAANENIRVTLFADNLWDERAVYEAGHVFDRVTRAFVRPRTIGLELDVSF